MEEHSATSQPSHHEETTPPTAWISLAAAAALYHVDKTTISRIAQRHQIATKRDNVDQRMLLLDRERFLAVMNESVKYGGQQPRSSEM